MTGAPRRCYQFGPFRLEVSEHRLLCDGRLVPLTPKVFDVLRVLVQNGGRLVEKDTLLEKVWADIHVEEGALNRSVSVLRKALGEGIDGHKYIETVPKRGYRFVAPVIECDIPIGSISRLPRRVAAIGAALLVAGSVYALLRPTDDRRAEPPSPGASHRQVTFSGREGSPTLSSDGGYIAYVSDEKPERKLMVQQLVKGQPRAVFNAPEVGHLRWSPDGSELLLWARGSGRNGVYIIPRLGGAPRQVFAGQFVACWSPTAAMIAVASYMGGKIWMVDTLGRAQRTISLQEVDWSIWAIDWSAARDLLVFVSSDKKGRYSIWTIRPDGSAQTKILAADIEIPSARWAPRGDAIYYFRRVNQTTSLQKIPVAADGTVHAAAETTIIAGLEADRSFAVSADGRRLIYARAPYYSNLWMLDARSGRSIELTRGTSLVERPRVSPDGTAVVFNMGHEPLTNLYTMPLAGGTPKQLTFFDAINVGGVWSPDGKRIAFASTQGGAARIWTVEAGGGIGRPLATANLSENLDLAWSPASRILYQQAGNRNYQEIDPESAELRLLAKNDSVGWMFAPVSSQDGAKIAVHWVRRPRGIWVIDRRDGRETPVYASSSASLRPIGWSADGKSIYVVEGKGAHLRGLTSFVGTTMTAAKILRLGARGGAVETVAKVPNDEIGSVTMTRDGRWFVYPVFSSHSDVWVVDDFDVQPDLSR
jgi:Tol biopolymer transport system component/DNA-binding winged helix-turn-helix (wHTH) protein